MKKIISLILIFVLIMSIGGCAPKKEYDSVNLTNQELRIMQSLSQNPANNIVKIYDISSVLCFDFRFDCTFDYTEIKDLVNDPRVILKHICEFSEGRRFSVVCSQGWIGEYIGPTLAFKYALHPELVFGNDVKVYQTYWNCQ